MHEHDEDYALEQCEEIVLAKWRSQLESEEHLRDTLLERVADDFARHLERQAFIEEFLEELGERMESREYGAGETMVAAGLPCGGLQILREGQASQFDSNGTRISQLSPGDVIEPRGAFDTSPAALTTIAVEPCRTTVLGPEARTRLERSHAQRMLEFYQYLFTTDATVVSSSILRSTTL